MARVGAKALITCGRVGSFEHCRLATRVAADVFSIRYVCGFGDNLSDGVVPLARPVHGGEARSDPAARSRRQCRCASCRDQFRNRRGRTRSGRAPSSRIAGGRHVRLVRRPLSTACRVFCRPSRPLRSPESASRSCRGSSPAAHFSCITLSIADLFAAQRRDERCGTLILPAPVVFRFADTGLFDGENPATILAEWRAPDRLAGSALWRQQAHDARRCAGFR